jgi:hypothetical protein
MFFLLLSIHWIGCLWYLIVKGIGSWMPPKDQNAGVTDFYIVSAGYQYLVVAYYAMLLIIGNDVSPTNVG